MKTFLIVIIIVLSFYSISLQSSLTRWQTLTQDSISVSWSYYDLIKVYEEKAKLCEDTAI